VRFLDTQLQNLHAVGDLPCAILNTVTFTTGFKIGAVTWPPPPDFPPRPPLKDTQTPGSDHDRNRLKSMLLEVPGSEWTVADAAKLSGLEPSVCRAILYALTDSGFLSRRSNGAFVRGSAPAHAESDRTADPVHQAAPAEPANLPLERIRREYLEMPNLRLTESQAQRLCGMDAAALEPAIQRLVAKRFLCRTPSGAYSREKRKWPRPAPVKATLVSAVGGRQSA
jgi:hypothetical protein